MTKQGPARTKAARCRILTPEERKQLKLDEVESNAGAGWWAQSRDVGPAAAFDENDFDLVQLTAEHADPRPRRSRRLD